MQAEIHSIYLIEGPSGVYVGCTRHWKSRRSGHWSAARRAHGGQPVHKAMRRDGLSAYTFRIVAQTKNIHSGRCVESTILHQLRCAGEPTLNEVRAYHRVAGGFFGQWFMSHWVCPDESWSAALARFAVVSDSCPSTVRRALEERSLRADPAQRFANASGLNRIFFVFPKMAAGGGQ